MVAVGWEAAKGGVEGVDEVVEGEVHRLGQAESSGGFQRGEAVAGGPPHADGVDEVGAVEAVARKMQPLHRKS